MQPYPPLNLSTLQHEQGQVPRAHSASILCNASISVVVIRLMVPMPRVWHSGRRRSVRRV
jgi:hypothetical protein